MDLSSVDRMRSSHSHGKAIRSQQSEHVMCTRRSAGQDFDKLRETTGKQDSVNTTDLSQSALSFMRSNNLSPQLPLEISYLHQPVCAPKHAIWTATYLTILRFVNLNESCMCVTLHHQLPPRHSQLAITWLPKSSLDYTNRSRNLVAHSMKL